jgi:chitinase
VAATAASREHFAASCTAFVKDHGFDGLDVDWEYPVEGGLDENVHRPQDGENFIALLGALRSALDAASTPPSRYLLTIAASAVPRTFEHLDLARVAAPLDWMNLMTYDFNGGWSSFVAHNAPLFPSPSDPSADAVQRERYNGAATVDAYLEGGVPAAKLTLGIPFYARGWGGVPRRKNGLFQIAKGPLPRGIWDAGVFDYGELAAQYIGHGDFIRSWDADAKVPSLYSPSRGIFVSYEDPQSIAEKARFISARSLGGAMVWNLSSDDARGTLLSALHDAL